MDLRYVLNEKRHNKNNMRYTPWNPCPPPPPPSRPPLAPPSPPPPPSGPPQVPLGPSTRPWPNTQCGFGDGFGHHHVGRYTEVKYSGKSQLRSNFVQETQQNIRDLNTKITKLEQSNEDIRRQFTKKNLVVFGQDVPEEKEDEDVTTVFISCIWRAYGINVRRTCVAQCHRLGNGIICEFVWRGVGSTFRNILERARTSRKDRRSGDLPKIYVSLQRSAEDRTIVSKCRLLKKNGLIKSYDRCDISGKYRVRFPGGQEKTVQGLWHLNTMFNRA